MATGALDANGIWQYGEDDSNTTFSALLNRLGSSTSTQQASNKSRLTTLESKDGLIPIVPSSVAVTGSGSGYSVSTLGAVTFTAAATLQLSNVFTTDYANYKIVINYTTSTTGTADNNTYLRMNSVSTGYTYVNTKSYGTVVTGSSATSAPGWYVSLTGAPGYYSSSSIDVYKPFETQPTRAIWATFADNSLGYQFVYNGSGILPTSTSYTNVSLVPGAGQLSGTISVYGYND